jgi:hypothetical protein
VPKISRVPGGDCVDVQQSVEQPRALVSDPVEKLTDNLVRGDGGKKAEETRKKADEFRKKDPLSRIEPKAPGRSPKSGSL